MSTFKAGRRPGTRSGAGARRSGMAGAMALVLAAALPAHAPGDPPGAPALRGSDPGPSVRQQPPPAQVIAAWLWCDECRDEQLEAVARLGQEAVGPLSQMLRAMPAGEQELLRRRSIAQWLSIRDTGVDSAAWVNRRVASYTARFQRQSAVALARLERWDTLRVAIENSATRGYRGDVVQTLQYLVFNEQPEDLLPDDGRIIAVLTVDSLGAGARPVEEAVLQIRRCRVAMALEGGPVSGTCDTYTGFARTRRTNATGRAVFADLLEGVYEVRAMEDSLPAPLFGHDWRPTARLARLLGPGASATVRVLLEPAHH